MVVGVNKKFLRTWSGIVEFSLIFVADIIIAILAIINFSNFNYESILFFIFWFLIFIFFIFSSFVGSIISYKKGKEIYIRIKDNRLIIKYVNKNVFNPRGDLGIKHLQKARVIKVISKEVLIKDIKEIGFAYEFAKEFPKVVGKNQKLNIGMIDNKDNLYLVFVNQYEKNGLNKLVKSLIKEENIVFKDDLLKYYQR